MIIQTGNDSLTVGIIVGFCSNYLPVTTGLRLSWLNISSNLLVKSIL